MKTTKQSRIGRRLVMTQRQKPILRYVVTGALLLLIFGGAFIFMNIGFNKQSRAATNYTWTGAVSSDCSNGSNWSPAGVPTTSDNIIAASSPNPFVLTTNCTAANITLNTGAVINLNGYNLTATGNAAFNAGTISGSGTIYAQGSSTTFGSGASGPTIAPAVTVTSATFTSRNTTFNGNLSVTKSGTSNDQSNGNNTYNGTVTYINNGTGYLLLSAATRDIYNGDVTYTNNSAGLMYVAYADAAGTQFNGNVIVNNTGAAGINFGGNNGGSTLASNKTITVGGTGFTAGTLTLRNFSQLGVAEQVLTLTGTANLTLGPASTFNGGFTSTTSGVSLNGCTFNGTTNITKYGNGSENGSGNNVFAAATTITNNGSGYLLLGNGNPDIFNGDVTFNNSGTSYLYVAYASAGNQFNGNTVFNNNGTGTNNYILVGEGSATSSVVYNGKVTANCTGTATNSLIRFNLRGSSIFNGNIEVNSSGMTSNSYGVYIGWPGWTGSSTLASGKTISIGSSGFSKGTLCLDHFTQLGADNLSLNLSGTANLIFGAGSVMAGNVVSSSSGLTLNGTTFNGTADLIKTGATSEASGGGNVFNGVATITNNGSGYLLMGNGNPDIFNSTTTFNNSGSNYIYLAHNSIGNQFNGVTTLNNSGSGTYNYIMVCEGTAISTAIFNQDVIANNLSSANYGLIRFSIYGSTTFNGNVEVSSTGGTSNSYGVYFGWNGYAGTTTLAAGKTVTVGAAGFSKGTLYFDHFSQTSATDQSFVLTGTATVGFGSASTFGGNIVSESPGLLLNGCTFNGTATLTKTGASSDGGTGGNTFNGVTTITNSGSGYMVMGNTNPDIFNADVTLNNSGSNYLYLAHNSLGNQFNGVATINNNGTGTNNYVLICEGSANSSLTFNNRVTFNNTSTATNGLMRISTRGITTFNDDIVVNSTGGTSNSYGVYFSWPGHTGTNTLAATKTITVGSTGFSKGTLYFGNFTQVGATPTSLSLTGTSVLTFGANTTFNGKVTAVSPSLYFNGSTFNDIVNATKNGTTSDASSGGNTFNSITTLGNSGSGYLMMSVTNRDVYNADVTFNNFGSSYIYPNYIDAAAPTQYNGNIIVNNTSSLGVYFGNNSGSGLLAANKTITIGSSGFNAGTLSLRNFTQTGSTPQSFTLSGSGVLTLGPNTNFGGDVVTSSAGLYLNGTTFNGTGTFTKTGSTNDQSTGNNVFNGVTSITNNGSGYVLMSATTKDIFNNDVTFNNLGTSLIYANYNDATGTQYNGNITLNSTSGTGIYFGTSTGVGTLAATKTISIGSLGFSAGMITLRNFISLSNEPTVLSATGSGGLTFGPASRFTGTVSANANSILLNGTTYNADASFVKTGSTNDAGQGNNVFNGRATINNSGTGYFLLALTTRDIFNGDVVFNNTNTNIIYPAYSDAIGTAFNGNIYLNNTSTGSIRFGQNTGASILADGKTISIGSTGFNTGELYLRRFTQLGTTPQSISITSGTMTLYLQTASIFNAAVDFNTPQVYLNGTTFNGVTNIQKNGATNNASSGANSFNAATTIRNSGTGIFYLANGTADDFNSNVNFVQTGTGALYPAYNTNSTFAGDIATTGSTAVLTFGNAAGTVTLDGSSPQNINGSSSFIPIFRRLTMNNGTNGVTLNVPISVSVSLGLTSGNINTSSSNLLSMSNASTISGVTNASYVSGPMRKIGNQAFTFPVGKSGYYSPIAISAPTASTDHFTAEYFMSDPHLIGNINNRDVTLHHVSRTDYWDLSRTNGASNVNVTLSWNTHSGGVSILSDLRVARWDIPTSRWRDLGNGATTGSTVSGTVITSSATTGFGGFTLGSISSGNALPIELISFNVSMEDKNAVVKWVTASEENNDYFTIERSADRHHFEPIGTVKGAGNSRTPQSYSLLDPKPLGATSYYRLKQTDFNGHFEYFNPVSLKNDNSVGDLSVNTAGPNPFSDEFNLDFNSASSAPVTITLISGSGAVVFQEKTEPSEGSNLFRVSNIAHLPQGIYFLQLVQDDVRTVPLKLIKK